MEDEGIGYSMTGLVAQIKEKYFAHTEEGVTIKLAESYGFCWASKELLQMCYEARKEYPTKEIGKLCT